MLFNSIDFAIFLPVVFLLYWGVFHRSVRTSNIYLTVVSYIFYGWWDWRFLSLIFVSTVVDYAVGLGLERCRGHRPRRLLLFVSIGVNLGILGVFKYYDFFVTNFVSLFTFFARDIRLETLQIVLPVGISFYTFQTLSYTIDIYRRDIEATRSFFAFSAYVSFFPQLVAGPIERAKNLLPQFLFIRQFDYRTSVAGLRQILWGLFKKIVIADNCAPYVDMIFSDPSSYTGSVLILGGVLFSFQIYGDFSGYSDVAIGTSKLFGVRLRQNFNFPYFSRNIAEFWRRWHISLTSWFRDYVYVPLGGSRRKTSIVVRNVFLVFLISGFWHGANWTFVVWGALNAAYFLPLLLNGRHRIHVGSVAEGRLLPSPGEFIGILSTYLLTLVAWVFFRAETVGDALQYLSGMMSASIFAWPNLIPLKPIVLILAFVVIEWFGRSGQYAIEKMGLSWPRPLRLAFYYLIVILIFLLPGEVQDFIYFQF